MVKRLFIIVSLSFLFASCTEEVTPDTGALGLKYYPLQTGDYWIYQVTETRFKNQFPNQANDSVSYFVRERVDSVFKDLTNEDTYKIIRSRRNTSTEEWGTDSVFVVNKSTTDVRVTQNNVRMVNFIFPVTDGKKWNPHIFNSQSSVANKPEETFYSFADQGQSWVINGTTYLNTVRVVQLNNENAIERQNKFEVYAFGIGRIYKQVIAYNYCSDPDRQNGCEVGKQFIVTGLKQVEKLQEHGSFK